MRFQSIFEDDELFNDLFVEANTDDDIRQLVGNQQIEDDPSWFEAFG